MEYALCRTTPQFPRSSQVCCPDCSWCHRSCPPWRTGPWCPPGDPDDVNDDDEGDGLAIQVRFKDVYDNDDDDDDNDDDNDDDDFTQAVLLSQATWSEMSSSIARITHLITHDYSWWWWWWWCWWPLSSVSLISLITILMTMIILCFWIVATIPVTVDEGNDEEEEGQHWPSLHYNLDESSWEQIKRVSSRIE